MENITLVGIDLAKDVFHLSGVNHSGRVIWHRKERRDSLLEAVERAIPKGAIVAMEACGSSHYWGRQFEARGYKARLIPPQFVTPLRAAQKNDRNDGDAITEAARRTSIHFVELKTQEQQEVVSLLNRRMRAVCERTKTANQLHALLLEFGSAAPRGIARLKRFTRELLGDETRQHSVIYSQMLQGYLDDLTTLEEREKLYSKQLKAFAQGNSLCCRLMKEPGVGVIISVSLWALVPNPRAFKNGRQFAAWIGLVPRQNSTGGRTVLGHITKRGQAELRRLLVHGARSVVRTAKRRPTELNLWVEKLRQRRHVNIVTVAVANKLARIAWRLMVSNAEYDEQMLAKTREHFAAA